MTEDILNAQAGQHDARRRSVRRAIFGVWAAVICFQVYITFGDPSPVNIVTAGGFLLLFAAANAQVVLARWVGERRLLRAMTRLQGSGYLSDLDGLPNRNYLLSELRREMPRSRASGKPFVLIILSIETFDDIVTRRGEDFGQRSLKGLAQVLKRFTRTSDFVAHLQGSMFCVMLNECRHEDAFIYLGRVPGTIAVSDGRTMFEVPVTARVDEYDMENLYATDVLRDAEESKPLQRQHEERYGSVAA